MAKPTPATVTAAAVLTAAEPPVTLVVEYRGEPDITFAGHAWVKGQQRPASPEGWAAMQQRNAEALGFGTVTL